MNKAEAFIRLKDNADFQLWLSESVGKRLALHEKTKLSSDPFTEDGQESIRRSHAAIGELKYISEYHFTIWDRIGQLARKRWSELRRK